MVYDSAHRRVILFGGWAGGAEMTLAQGRVFLDDTWAYDPQREPLD